MALPFIGAVARNWCGALIKHETSEDFEGGILTVVGLQLNRPIRTSEGCAEFIESLPYETVPTTSEFTETLPPSDMETAQQRQRRFSRNTSYDATVSYPANRKRSFRQRPFLGRPFEIEPVRKGSMTPHKSYMGSRIDLLSGNSSYFEQNLASFCG
ncbi:hypothetical protein Tcan_18801 [Toxocara canis]|uniref:Uncharacterized protein n=1 Tax=Toxocara canis TaxID=6265 RepID=A0A0B2VWI6_TOXCA|nr:hypothetical protein Tcan_18801 [Toxocara canis]